LWTTLLCCGCLWGEGLEENILGPQIGKMKYLVCSCLNVDIKYHVPICSVWYWVLGFHSRIYEACLPQIIHRSRCPHCRCNCSSSSMWHYLIFAKFFHSIFTCACRYWRTLRLTEEEEGLGVGAVPAETANSWWPLHAKCSGGIWKKSSSSQQGTYASW
jgi:hypothetical protein